MGVVLIATQCTRIVAILAYDQGCETEDCQNSEFHSIIIITFTLLQFVKNMGNIAQHDLTNIPNRLQISQFKEASLRGSIGPWNLNFTKVKPKDIEKLQEQSICPHYQEIVPLEQQEVQQEEDELEPVAEEGAIEAIKIKWNSFIKMKKKNYLEDYTILKEVGRGGFGTVYKVQAKFTGVLRAAKRIKKTALAKGEHEKLFAEMAIMITLDHPNIARLFEVYDYKTSYVLILELCQGGELFKKIITKAINEEIAVVVFTQLLEALLYLHAKKIVHRDLKPENMLLSKSNFGVKLIDFGIAVRKQTSEPLSARIGTPYYIAPEVLCKHYDQKCDLWSAGVILYMMISFRPPFNGDNQTEVMENILKMEPNYKGNCFKNVSEDCVDLIKKLLCKNPHQRPSALEAYDHPWIQKNLKRSIIRPQVIDTISKFKFTNKLEAVVYTFIVSQILTSEQKQMLKELFQDLDCNHDGVISTQQLKKALSTKNISPERISFLMRVIDTNGSGMIDFTEFIVAALQPQDLSSHHFEQAFAYFDIDHSGVISYDEIAAFLEDRQGSEQEINKIFKDVDENHDGEISKEQFLKVLLLKGKERMEKFNQRDKSRQILTNKDSIKNAK